MTETLSKTIAASDVVGFAQLTGDRNPIHLSEHFAARTQFGRRIAHGLYTASLISAVLGTRLPGPGAIYISQTLNFHAPVKIGDQVDVTVTVAELIPERQRARLTCTCTVAGETVLDGEALVKVPSAAKSKRPLPRILKTRRDLRSETSQQVRACSISARPGRIDSGSKLPKFLLAITPPPPSAPCASPRAAPAPAPGTARYSCASP